MPALLALLAGTLLAGCGLAGRGDPEAGAVIFSGPGRCSQCHMVAGVGGRLGPDLSRIGVERPSSYLRDSIRQPSRQIFPGYETVVAVTRDGRRITGVRRNEDTFSFQLMDEREQLHLFLKEDLERVLDDSVSLMPAYDERALDDEQLHDLVAYLKTLRGGEELRGLAWLKQVVRRALKGDEW